MKIIICGDGDTGSHLSRQLSLENQDVLLIGQDREHLADLDARYNIMTMEGSGLSPADLREAGVAGCDLFIAVTPWENNNMISCQLARALGAARTVARIDNSGFMTDDIRRLFAATGIDTMVFPEFLAAGQIESTLHRCWCRNWFELHDGQLIVAGVRVAPGAPLDGRHLHELAKSEHPFHVAAIKRRDMMIIPHGDDRIAAGDILYISILPADIGHLPPQCGAVSGQIRRIIISGADRMTRQLVKRIGGEFDITVIDADPEKCRRLSTMAPQVTVVNADQRDIDVLREEGIDSADAFIGLNESSEMNIIGCMIAREAGVAKTIAEIEDIQYIAEADALNIDVVVNKKLLTSSTIFQMLLDSGLPTPRCLALEDAEVAEIIVDEGSKATRRPVMDLNLPKGINIAGVIRDGVGRLVSGSTVLRGGDHVVVVCLSGALDKFTRTFR